MSKKRSSNITNISIDHFALLYSCAFLDRFIFAAKKLSSPILFTLAKEQVNHVHHKSCFWFSCFWSTIAFLLLRLFNERDKTRHFVRFLLAFEPNGKHTQIERLLFVFRFFLHFNQFYAHDSTR